MSELRPGLYFATDKDIFDLLESSKQKVTERTLLHFLRRRGLLVSDDDSREELVRYVSELPLDFGDLTELFADTEKAQRPTPVTPIEIGQGTTQDSVVEIVRELQRTRTGEKIGWEAVSENIVRITVEYSEFDFGKTRLRQRTEREASIEVSFDASATVIRHPATEKGRSVAGDVVAALRAATAAEVPIRKVELSGIASFATRSRFFIELTRCIPGFQTDDVTKVKVDSRKPAADLAADTTETAEDDAPDDSTPQPENASADEEMLGVVRKIALEGRAVLASEEYQQLSERFYIYRLAWTATSQATGDLVDFEAWFGNPPEATDFQYSIKGMHRPKEDGGHAKVRTPVRDAKRSEIATLLEQGAKAAIDKIMEE